ncbi:MAG: hypothetical protein J7L96_03565 [Bacteroidales bacterium]|nr:hypothetical protein [Bacteroidales bacterium]
MKHFILLLLSCLTTSLFAQYDLNYYLPDGLSYDPDIPTPEQVLGYGVGEFHISHDKLVRYMQVLDDSSDRVSLQVIGYTHENRPLIQVIFTSAENQKNLEKLRKDHLESINPLRNKNNVRDEPLIINLGYTVHGNEASGANAAPVVAYYLAACQNEEVIKMLNKSIILLDPCLNPDGMNRFASWVNSHKSLTNNPDPASIEFREAYPGSRTNHYWIDLNRDWLFAQQPESQARISSFQHWKPVVLTDHHEMGGSSTFFFQPGVRSRSNPIVPQGNYELTQKIGTYHAKALDQIGSLYFTQEQFDDFYFGKGSSYPDLNGAIGILFEQASSRGSAQENAYGVLTFPFTIRNQVRASLSTLEGAWAIRKELQYHQQDFFESALKEAEESPVKGYIFESANDPKRSQMMIDILEYHQIKVLPVKTNQTIRSIQYPAGESYLIDCHQAQYRMIRTLMEKVTSFEDSTFYDISTWTLPLAMGVQYAELDTKELAKVKTGKALITQIDINGSISSELADQAYLFEWDPYLAPKALYQLLDSGIIAKVSSEPFTITNDKGKSRNFDYGTIMIPVQPQEISNQKLHSLLYNLAHENGLNIYAANTAYTINGPDLGSGSFHFVKKPSILVLTGGRISSREAGQIWHLFDTRFMIMVTLGDVGRFNSLDLSRYNTLIMPGGSYSEIDSRGTEKLKNWIREGGKVIALKSANSFLKSSGIIKYSLKPAGKYKKADGKFLPFSRRRKDNVGRSIPGSIFKAHLDLSHPLGYGYNSPEISIFKNSTGFIAPSANPYGNPLYFTKDPLQSGYINEQNLKGLRESIVVLPNSFGRGKVISFFDDPTFRAYFAGEHKLLLNALFFGEYF